MPFILSPGNPGLQMIAAITAAGALTGLKFCGDAGQQSSYDPAQVDPQKWLDTSANAQDFYRGTTGSPESSDPVFNGNTGGLSINENWSFNGSQKFTVVGGANPVWVDPMHKAGAVWGYLAFGLVPGFYAAGGSCTPTSGNTGVNFQVNAGLIRTSVWNAGSIVLDANSSVATLGATNNIWGATVNGAVGSGAFFFANGVIEAYNDTYSGPSAGSSTNLLGIGNSGGNITQAGSLMYAMAIWQGTIPTSAQYSKIYNLLRGRLNLA